MSAAASSRPSAPKLVRWPAMPLRPSPGTPLLVRVPAAGSRADMRREGRAVVRAILADWGLRHAAVEETPAGPRVRTAGGPTVGLSISYAEDTVWIAFRIGGEVGVDAMIPHEFIGLDQVARDYLGDEEARRIAGSLDRARAFAAAWTRHEARLKLAHAPLTEQGAPRGLPAPVLHTLKICRFLVSVAC